MTQTSKSAGKIRVGIGGWTYKPWRGAFYPEGLAAKQELEWASCQVSAIEVNGTFYRSFKPAVFAGWARTVPEGFVFALKASRYCTNRKLLGEAGESIERFVGQGIVELGDKLGPILWQFAATKLFEREDFGAFLALLPSTVEGTALRHAVEVRHPSFAVPEFIALCREKGVAIVFADSPKYPRIADPTGSFVYARLQDAIEEEPAGYPPAALDGWRDVARSWTEGGVPADPGYVERKAPAASTGRDVFIFFINGAKVRAPAAAMALIDRLGREG